MNRLFLAVAVAAVLVPAAGRAADKEVYRIAIAKSAFRDQPPEVLALAGLPFQSLMKDQTGLDGEVNLDLEWAEVARNLDAGKLHFGVLHGHELAWARQKYPDLLPLVCSIYRPREVHALLLVRHDNKATRLADLKGAKVAVATTLKDHARLFLEKRRADELAGTDFSSTIKVDTVHDGFHKVLDGEADLTPTDNASWNYFQKLYPGKSQNLKVIAKSEEFPATVLVYKKGTVSDAILKTFRDGFLAAHKTTKGVRLMSVIKLEKFDPIPDGYDDALKTCLKLYPLPKPEK